MMLSGRNTSRVRIPMMPKGVEHKSHRASSEVWLLCENSDDAERR